MKKLREIESWNITANPKGDTYKRLIETLCLHSDQFYFITRKELKYNEEIIATFSPYTLNTYKTQKWAGTETTDLAATVYIIESNAETYQLLVKHANSLFDWVSPTLPEDLTFIKNNFTWFSCTTHEGFANFSIRSDYYKRLMCRIEGLVLEQAE